LVELSDEKILQAVTVNVGPAGCCVARALHADGHAARRDPDRMLEFRGSAGGGAAEGQQ
jgi:hypothetical protein